MTSVRRPTVFVTHADESPDHREDVLRLCHLLREQGIGVVVDADAPSRPLDWGRWTTEEIRAADYVLVIASPALRAAADGTLAAEAHRGARAEMALLREYWQQDHVTWSAKTVPVLLPGRAPEGIPDFIGAWNHEHYRVTSLDPAGIRPVLVPVLGLPRRQPAGPGPGTGTTAGGGSSGAGRLGAELVSGPMADVIRAGIGAWAAGRPAFGLVGPVVRVRIDRTGAALVLHLESAAAGNGSRCVAVRCLPIVADRPALGQLLDLGPVLAVPADHSEEQAALARTLRLLAHLARATDSAAEFSAAVLRVGGSQDAAELHARMLGPGSTTADRRRLHEQLRRLRVPRPAELAALLEVWPDDPARATRAAHAAEEALQTGVVDLGPADPAPAARADRAASSGKIGVQPASVFAVPPHDSPAEHATRHAEIAAATGLLADAGVGRRVALVGPGGMGKTALALRLCHALVGRYQVVGWLSARDAAAWQASVAVLGERLGVSTVDAQVLWDALAERAPALIVVDDAPEPAAAEAALPLRAGLHLLLTTQSPRWRAEGDVIELPPLPLSEATEFLLRRTGADDERLAEAVAQRLGGLPIALEQAAAAVVDGLSLRGWLDRYHTSPGVGAPALRQAWQLRLGRLRTEHPDALRLLRILSCAGGATVPGELLDALTSGPDHPDLAVCGPVGRRDDAVRELRRQHLVATGVEQETLSVHPLLAEAVRADSGTDVATLAERVAAAAGDLIEPEDVDRPAQWPRTAALSAVAVAACRLVLDTNPDGPWDRTMRLANHALWLPACYLHERGAAREAYRARLLGLALHGDAAAAAAVRGWSAPASDAFADLAAGDVVPAGQLGEVARGAPRLSAARWLNENVTLLSDVDTALSEAYGLRALRLIPSRVIAASSDGPVPWPDRMRIEIFDNFAWVVILRGDYRAAVAMFDRALRRQRSYPGGDTAPKHGELLSDRALVLLDQGLPRRAAPSFARALATEHPDPMFSVNVRNNLARAEHELGHVATAHSRLVIGLEQLWRSRPAQDTDLLIQQCNTGLAAYDLGDTDHGYELVEGSWLTLRDRLGPSDRETLIRRYALAGLQFARGDLRTAADGVRQDLDHERTKGHPESPWPAQRLLQAAWLSGADLVSAEAAEQSAAKVLRRFDGRGRHAAAALDLQTASVLAGGWATPEDATGAREAIRLHSQAVGRDHPETLMARARLALLTGAGQLAAGPARVLLTTPDSLTTPGTGGFEADLARHGQPAVESRRPAWEADRLQTLLDRGLLDLEPGEHLCWRANAGRLAAVGGVGGAVDHLREAAAQTAALYGPHHPWTRLREATAAVAADDRDALRRIATAPRWI